MPEDARVPGPKKRWLTAVGAAVLAVVVLGGGWFLLKETRTTPAAAASVPAAAVGVRLVVQKGVSQSFEFVGHIKAIDKVELRARVEGFLEKRLFHEGQFVKAGDLLYQIEKVQYEALVEQAKANLAATERHREAVSGRVPKAVAAHAVSRSEHPVEANRSTRRIAR